jgi:hypothetical protein
MCKKQKKHLLQTAFWRMQLYVRASGQGWLGFARGVVDPEDPYRSWDSFLEVNDGEGVHTAQERWLAHALWEMGTKIKGRIAEQKDLIQQYKDDMWDDSDSSLDSSINVGLVSRDGSCSSFTDVDGPQPHWDFEEWLIRREAVPRPSRDRAHHEYWAIRRAQERAEVRQAEMQAGTHWDCEPSPNEDVSLPVINRTPGADAHGRAFSSDEDGDGPCVPIHQLRRCFRSCFGKQNERHCDLMVVQALRERAEVPPICEVCNTPCKMYNYCYFCRLGPVMHHGRCCWWNPGQRRRRAHEARDASDADWLEQNMRWHDTAQQD